MKKFLRGTAIFLGASAIWWAAAILVGAVIHFTVAEALSNL